MSFDKKPHLFLWQSISFMGIRTTSRDAIALRGWGVLNAPLDGVSRKAQKKPQRAFLGPCTHSWQRVLVGSLLFRSTHFVQWNLRLRPSFPVRRCDLPLSFTSQAATARGRFVSRQGQDEQRSNRSGLVCRQGNSKHCVDFLSTTPKRVPHLKTTRTKELGK